MEVWCCRYPQQSHPDHSYCKFPSQIWGEIQEHASHATGGIFPLSHKWITATDKKKKNEDIIY